MRLFLVLDDGSGEASAFALAKDGAEAIEHTKYLLAGDEDDTSELRPVTTDTTRNAETRELLSIWEPIALEATKELRADLVEKELNGLEALIPAVVRVFEREKARAIAEAIELDRAAIRDALTSNTVDSCKLLRISDEHAQLMSENTATLFDRAVKRSIDDREKRISSTEIFAGGGAANGGAR